MVAFINCRFLGFQDTLYPQLAFRVACDILGVPAEKIIITPGKNVELTLADKPSIKIPIDDKGDVLINWTGNGSTRWEDIFAHIPYVNLIQIRDNPERFEKMKQEIAPKIKDKILFYRDGRHRYHRLKTGSA